MGKIKIVLVMLGVATASCSSNSNEPDYSVPDRTNQHVAGACPTNLEGQYRLNVTQV